MSFKQIALSFYLAGMLLLTACATSLQFADTKFANYIETTHVSYIYKWERVKADADRQLAAYTSPTWEKLIADSKTLEDVNKNVNRYQYKDDFQQFGQDEYWQTPFEFIKNRGGDCEDYAITKYYILKAKGYKDEDLKIVILKTQDGGGHAVLIVRDGSRWLMLDNRYKRVIDVTKIPEVYTPYWAMNHTKYWTYVR